MKRLLVTVLLILSYSIALSQAWQWEWARSVESNVWGFQIDDEIVSYADANNNIYRLISFDDSICFPGVKLTSPDPTRYINLAIAIYREDGTFLKAFDLHYESNYFRLPEIVADKDGNIYVAGRFREGVLIRDTMVLSRTGNNLSSEQVFIAKLNNNLEIIWINLIYSESRTVLNGLCMIRDENLVLATDHSSFQHKSTKAFFLDQDSTIFVGGLISIITLSKEGTMVWREEIRNIGEDQSGQKVFYGLDCYLHFFGYTRYPVIIGSDTLALPPNSMNRGCLFFTTQDENGNFLRSNLLPWNLSIWDLKVSKSGKVYFTGEIWDTLCFGQDTIIRPEPIHDFQFIGCVNKDFEPVWYRTATTGASDFENVSLNLLEDTLLYTTQSRYLLNIAGETFSIGEMEAFTGFFTPEGQLTKTLLTQCDHDLVCSSAILDNHNNLLLAGYFQFEAYFGRDTLDSNGYPDFFLAKFRMYCPPAINLGNYTAIHKNDSLYFDAGPGYDKYHWSTGDSTNAIIIHGSDFGTGTHTITVEATEGPCTGRDSITFTILNNPGIHEPEFLPLNIHPNPSSGVFFLEPLESECRVSVLNSCGISLPGCPMLNTGKERLRIDLTNQPAGIYFLNVITTAGVRTIKFIKL